MIANQTRKEKVIKRSKKDNFMLWENSTKDNISGYNCYYVFTDYKGNYINSFTTFKMAEKEIEKRTKRNY